MKYLAYLMMFLLLIIPISAFSLDDIEDTFIAKPGEVLIGSFIVDSDVNIETRFEWLSFDQNVPSYSTSTFTTGRFIERGYYQIPYYITIPEDADIGIYRTKIKVFDDESIKYLNIKISVQNGLFRPFFKVLNNPLYTFIFFIVILSILVLFLSFKIYMVIKR